MIKLNWAMWTNEKEAGEADGPDSGDIVGVPLSVGRGCVPVMNWVCRARKGWKDGLQSQPEQAVEEGTGNLGGQGKHSRHGIGRWFTGQWIWSKYYYFAL